MEIGLRQYVDKLVEVLQIDSAVPLASMLVGVAGDFIEKDNVPVFVWSGLRMIGLGQRKAPIKLPPPWHHRFATLPLTAMRTVTGVWRHGIDARRDSKACNIVVEDLPKVVEVFQRRPGIEQITSVEWRLSERTFAGRTVPIIALQNREVLFPITDTEQQEQAA